MCHWKFACVLAASFVSSCSLLAQDKTADDAKSVINKAIAAAGGEANLAKTRTARASARGFVYSLNNSVQRSALTLDTWIHSTKMKTVLTIEMDSTKDTVCQVFDGTRGWLKLNGKTHPFNEASEKQTRESSHDFEVRRLFPLLNNPEFTLALADEKVINGSSAIGVRVTCNSQQDLTLHFDKSSYLLVQTSSTRVGPDGKRVPYDKLFLEHKKIAGVTYPTTVIDYRNGTKHMEISFHDVEFLSNIPPEFFSEP